MEATVQLGLDANPFEQGLNQAQSAATTFSGKLRNLFKRDSSSRAQHILGEFVADISSGNLEGALTSVATKLHGIGLAAGVGVGAAVVTFVHLENQINETKKAADVLSKELSKPLSAQAALGPEGIAAQIASTTKAVDALAEKRKSLGSRIREAAFGGAPDAFDIGAKGEIIPVPFDRTTPEARKQEAGEQRIRDLQRERAQAELDIAKVKDISVHSSELEAKFLQSSLDYEKRKAQITLESAPNKVGNDQVNFFKRLAAAREENIAGVDQINQKTNEELRQQKDITLELALQATGQAKLAGLVAIRSDSQTKINKATREGNLDQADEFRKQERIKRLSLEGNELGKSGPQKFQEFLDNSEKERLFNTAAAQEKDAADRRSRGSRADAATRAEEEAAKEKNAPLEDTIEDNVRTIADWTKNVVAA